MTYSVEHIEIASDGAVSRGGRHLGSMTFASAVARMDAVGEHIAEGCGYTDDDLEYDNFGRAEPRKPEVRPEDRIRLALHRLREGGDTPAAIRALETGK